MRIVEDRLTVLRRLSICSTSAGTAIFFEGGNLRQSIPKFVFQRDASLLVVDHDGAFDDGGVHAVAPARAATDQVNMIQDRPTDTRRIDSVGKGGYLSAKARTGSVVISSNAFAAKKLVALGFALWSCCICSHLFVIGSNPKHYGAHVLIVGPIRQCATFFGSPP
jgi:hypothetical protein